MKNKEVWIGVIASIVLLGLIVWYLESTPAADITPTTISPTSATPSSGGAAKNVKVKYSDAVMVAESLSSGTRFAALLTSTGVSSEVRGAGPYTIFVPTDKAFALLPPGTVSDLSSAGRKRLVEYHVVVGRAIDADALSSGSVTALSRDMLNFQVSPDKSLLVNSSKIVGTYQATNGVVYLINGVLLPPVGGIR